MVSLRSSKRQQERNAGSSRTAKARAPSSSSSVKGSLRLQSDENASHVRQALGDIKNVAAGRRAEAAASGTQRKPLGDRNAPPQSQQTQAKSKARPASKSAAAAKSKLPPPTSRTASTRPKRSAADQSAEAKPSIPTRARSPSVMSVQAVKRTEYGAFSHVEVPSTSHLREVSAGDSLSAQIEAAAHRTAKPAPTHAELSRVSPALDSDDLDYFDANKLPMPHEQHEAQDPNSSSKGGGSDAESATVHGSSDKENLPPPAARASASSDGSQPDSPGVARRAPLTESAQQLLDYQDRGVSKVMAWRAAGHDPAARLAQRTPSSPGCSNADSWPTEPEDDVDRAKHVASDESDEFGFFIAEREIRKRAQAPVGPEEQDAQSAQSGSVQWVPGDVPTDPFNASDDRRLAEHAFAGMSSPPLAPARYETPGSQPASVGHPDSDGEHDSTGQPAEEDSETSPSPPPVRRSTRVKQERQPVDESDVEAPPAKRRVATVTTRRRSERHEARRQSAESSVGRTSKPATKRVARNKQASPSSSSSDAEVVREPHKRKATKKAARKKRASEDEDDEEEESRLAANLRMDDYVKLLPPRRRATKSTPKARATAAKRKTKAKAKAKTTAKSNDDERDEVGSSPIHTDDSERTKAVKQLRAVEDYSLEVELVL
ncbi:hypothetical protein PANT_11c00067 [Moesziomyces antarcticus T-34]|uniref:Uncharacterized protein n=1 Tax=Pseudozyma antarctica (strain T-34) TaxID=1151754 RepID=M9MFL9_PSEA3|nr:hypothetical protein PANT_11c00067 [Moesziomyces antarcticus T-34]